MSEFLTLPAYERVTTIHQRQPGSPAGRPSTAPCSSARLSMSSPGSGERREATLRCRPLGREGGAVSRAEPCRRLPSSWRSPPTSAGLRSVATALTGSPGPVSLFLCQARLTAVRLTSCSPFDATVRFVRWSMRSWESVRRSPARRQGFPRSHGPIRKGTEHGTVKIRLTARCGPFLPGIGAGRALRRAKRFRRSSP